MEWKSLTPWNWMQKEHVGIGRHAGLPMRRQEWPATPLFGLQHEIDRLFSDTMRNLALPAWPEWSGFSEAIFRPHLEILEEDQQYTIRLEIPGVSKEEVDVSVAEDTLIIRGEKRAETQQEQGHCHYTERHFGAFHRTLAIPADAKSEELQASFKDGVLTITLPRKPNGGSLARKIEIH